MNHFMLNWPILWHKAHTIIIEELKESSMISYLIRQLCIRDVKCKRPNGVQTKNRVLLKFDFEQIFREPFVGSPSREL